MGDYLTGLFSAIEQQENPRQKNNLVDLISRGVALPPSPMFGYETKLNPMQEYLFRQWLSEGKNDPRQYFNPNSPNQDYDMRGYFKAIQNKDPRATSGVDPYDNKIHFTDQWKTPTHETFSNQSMWAGNNAPSWNNKDQLVDTKGNVVFDPSEEDRVRKLIEFFVGRGI